MTLTDKEQAVKYLLGDLTEVERDWVEERFFTDENFSRFIDDAETDLIDEFVRGELSEREAQLFSQNFLVSERRREKTRTAQILQNELFTERKAVNSVSTLEEKPSFWTSLVELFRARQIAFASFAVLLLLFGGWFVSRNLDTREIVKIEDSNSPTPEIISSSPVNVQTNQPSDISSGTNSKKNAATLANKTATGNQLKDTEKLAHEQKPKATVIKPTFASLLLLPATRSSNQSQTLNLKGNVKTVNLQIVNDRAEDFDRFLIEVRNIDGALISAQNFKNTNYNRKNFNLQISSQKLASADYQVTLKGADIGAEFQNLNYFYFSIEKK